MRKLEKEIKANMMSNTDHTLPKYPVFYECKYWTKEECNEIFINVYMVRCSLNIAGGVYMAEGLSCFPDGEIYEW